MSFPIYLMNKKAASQIEFIFSFVLFLGFVGFALILFNPLKSPGVTQVLSDQTLDEIIKDSSTEVISYSVKINNSARQTIDLTIVGVNDSYNVVAQDINGFSLNATRNENRVYLDRQGKNFSIIRYSSDFSSFSGVPSTGGDVGNYEIASSISEHFVSEKEIINLKTKYGQGGNSYNEIRDSLNLPSNKDFAFAVIFSNTDNITAEMKIPGSVEVFASEQDIGVLRTNGLIKYAKLIVKTW